MLASLALHAGLLAGLAALLAERGTVDTASSTLRVTVFPLVQELEQAVATEGPADESETVDEIAERPERAADAQADTTELEASAAERPIETPIEEPEDVAVAAATQALETEQPILEPAAEPTERASTEPPASHAEQPTEIVAAETESVQATEATDAAEIEATADAGPVRITEPVTAAESQRLERRIEQFAASFAALADWQPETTWSDRGQSYRATVARIPAAESTDVERAIVTVTTERDGLRHSTRLRMQRLGFSHFAQFIDRWDPEVQIHDDTIDGRFHSNSEIFIAHSGGVQPTFLGKVTAARGINTSRSDRRIRNDQVFLGGLDTRAARIQLPGRISLFDTGDDIDPARLQRFGTATEVVFAADGSYAWTPIESRRGVRGEPDASGASTGRGRLDSEPHYLVAADGAELHVRGTVNGKVLVYSPEDIVVTGSLVYADNPVRNQASDDYLGLVSERSVEIATPDVTGRGDLHVHAAIYARHRFAVRGYSRSDDATLHVYGSITAGSVTATEPRFRTRLSFDPRLENARPPRFPLTDRYEIAEWDGLWSIDESEPLASVPE